MHIRPALADYLAHAENLAQDIIKPTYREPNSSSYYLTPGYYYRPYSFDLWHPYQEVHHYHHPTTSQRRKSEKSNALLTLVFAILSGSVLYSFGKEYGISSNASRDLDRLNEDQNLLEKDLYQRAPFSSSTLKKIGHIHKLQKEILLNLKESSSSSLTIKGVTAAGTLTGMVGAFMGANTLLGTGILLTIGGGFAWAFKAGLETTDFLVQHRAKELLNEIHQLQSLLSKEPVQEN